MRGQKGITLVALIITIIVMLILVAVTVAVVVNSNLIGQAEKAANGYKNACHKVLSNCKRSVIKLTGIKIF